MSAGDPLEAEPSAPTTRERLAMAISVTTAWLIGGFFVLLGAGFGMLVVGPAALLVLLAYFLGGVYWIVYSYRHPRRPDQKTSRSRKTG